MNGDPQQGPSHAVNVMRMVKFAGPIIITHYTVVIMHVVDAWMLGRLGTTELAAVSTAPLLIMVLIGFGFGFVAVITTTVAQSMGKGLLEEGLRYGWQGVYAAMLEGVVCLGLWPLAEVVFQYFGKDAEVTRLEANYFRVSLLSVMPQLLYMAVSHYFFGRHRMMVVMVASLLGMILNAGLNYALIFGMFGAPKLGFIGAAWGTVAASWIQALMLMVVLLKASLGKGRPWRYSSRHFRKLCRLGAPAGVHVAIDIVSWGVLLIYLISQFGTDHKAAAAVLIRCMQMTFVPSDGLATALISLIGESVGKRDIAYARYQAKTAFQLIATYMVGMGMLFYLFRVELLSLFSADPRVIAIGVQAMVFVSFLQLFDALNVTYISALYGAGDTFWPSAMNLLLCILILVAGGFGISHAFPQLASIGIWLVATVYILAQGILFWLRWRSNHWEDNVISNS